MYGCTWRLKDQKKDSGKNSKMPPVQEKIVGRSSTNSCMCVLPSCCRGMLVAGSSMQVWALCWTQLGIRLKEELLFYLCSVWGVRLWGTGDALGFRKCSPKSSFFSPLIFLLLLLSPLIFEVMDYGNNWPLRKCFFLNFSAVPSIIYKYLHWSLLLLLCVPIVFVPESWFNFPETGLKS